MKDMYILKSRSKKGNVFYALVAEVETAFGLRPIYLTCDFSKVRALRPDVTDKEFVTADVGTHWEVI